MKLEYTELAQAALNKAKKISKDMQQSFVGSQHILFGLISVGKGTAYTVLAGNGLSKEKLDMMIEQASLEDSDLLIAGDGSYTERTLAILENAENEASRLGESSIGTEHILLALKTDSGI